MHGDESDAHQPTRSERRAADRRRTRSGAAPALSRRPVAATSARTRRNGPVRVVATVLVVPAIVGTVGLPAYALLPGGPGFEASGAFSLAVAQAQDVDLTGVASAASVSSDAYAVTSKAELDEARRTSEESSQAAWAAELASRAGSGSYAIYTVKAEGDDYPWWDQVPDDYGGGLSPLRYYYRECVDFVAWRLNRDAGYTSAPWKWDWGNLASGSAYAWADAWARKGWPTSSTPVVGAVAWFPYNHVAYVQSINDDGSVNLEEYNWNSDHSYHRRTIPAGDALYLYPPG